MKKGKREKEKKEKREKREKGKKGKRKKREKEKQGKKKKEKIRKKEGKRKRLTQEMASEGPQRITEKYYGVYLPSYTIYPFVIPLVIYPRCLFIFDDLVFIVKKCSKVDPKMR